MRRFLNIWVLATLALFYLGPVPWPGRESPLVALMVLSCLVAFNLGAVGGARLPALPRAPRPLSGSAIGRIAVTGLWVVLAATQIYINTGRVIFDPGAYSLDFGDVYGAYQAGAGERRVTSDAFLFALAVPLKSLLFVPAMVLLATEFRRRPWIAAAILFPFLGSSMMRGTDKEMADMLILIAVLCHYHRLMNRRFLLLVGLAVVFMVFFFERKIGRFGGALPRCLPGSVVCFDFRSPLATALGPSAEVLVVFLSNYLTQGYQGLSIAMQLPFEFNWGIGALPPLKDKLCDVLHIACRMGDFSDRLYRAGWDTRFHWQSAYTVIANDTHWLFVPVYFFAMGGLFGVSERSWRETGDGHSLVAVLLVSLFMIYASANMQIAIAMDWVVLTVFVLGGQCLRLFVRATRGETRPAPV